MNFTAFFKRSKYTEIVQVRKNEVVKFEAFSEFLKDMQHLFVYGSLLFPELVEKLTGKIFSTLPSILEGFKRFAVKGCDYPAIIQDENSNVEGLLILNIDEESIKILTFFEGDEYEIETVCVITWTKKMNALAFVWKSKLPNLEDFDWDINFFRENSLSHYLEKIAKETREDFKNLNF